jgi:excisionase family DNA binding protein
MATSEIAPAPLLTSSQAAAYLKISTDHIRRLCKDGRLAYTLSGGQKPHYYFTQRDLDQYLSRRYHTLKRFEAKWSGK